MLLNFTLIKSFKIIIYSLNKAFLNYCKNKIIIVFPLGRTFKSHHVFDEYYKIKNFLEEDQRKYDSFNKTKIKKIPPTLSAGWDFFPMIRPCYVRSEGYSQSSQASKMQLFSKIANGLQLLIIFTKSS